ncbi:MAG: SDR family NAD(P)-dependent oxidoreductase [Ilumatobacteraceae bacterium]
MASYRVASLSALGMVQHLEPLEDGERGVITLTASVAAQDAQVGQVAYGSCKAGGNGLVLRMARDLMNEGVRANSIMPGIFATPPMLGVPEKVLEVLSNPCRSRSVSATRPSSARSCSSWCATPTSTARTSASTAPSGCHRADPSRGPLEFSCVNIRKCGCPVT